MGRKTQINKNIKISLNFMNFSILISLRVFLVQNLSQLFVVLLKCESFDNLLLFHH